MMYRCIIGEFSSNKPIDPHQIVFEFESDHQVNIGEFVFSLSTLEIFKVTAVVKNCITILYVSK